MIIEYDKIALAIRTSKYALVFLCWPNDICETNKLNSVFNLKISRFMRISLNKLEFVE